MYTRKVSSSLGQITLASDGDALCGLWFDGQSYFPDTSSWIECNGCSSAKVFDAVERYLGDYFAGRVPEISFKLLLRGTPFQERVWTELLSISCGDTVTYGDIARKLSGGVSASRAIGTAVGRNPVSIIVPCHRVIGSSGQLTGYAGGLDRKIALLKIERE